MQYCPFCSKHVPNHENLTDEFLQPEEGDLSVCIKCGSICVFDEDLYLRKPTEEELAEAMANEEMLAVLNAWNSIQIQVS